ncbi:hypothetical protein D9758_008513 [Tetrapyrgos nigripes]|uniref:Uncharacterized protein n=1 Tax=Tetrapyrgos nigripes TaxID=182062 RepID=A0A8H5FQD9_9AGAR|nr:hypothetical protein D9758_008513 [Tetrapyrgos nigripes]
MHFTTALMLGFSFFAATAVAQDVGQSCPSNEAGAVGCANTASVNGGNAYIFQCNGFEFVLFAPCGCPTCCRTEGPFNAVCTSG